ncbi:MAG: redoxin domain-containing protein, partial [Patescibacteria group bacterium]
MKHRIAVLSLTFIAITGAILFLEMQKAECVGADCGGGSSDPIILSVSDRVASKKQQYEEAKEISSPDGFINTDGITVQGLIGEKVILLDFWTYSCINCQRTTPYLNAWYEKYKESGLEILGIHTPEFEFEKRIENVKKAVERFGIRYPVILDNDFSTWRAYRNQYWPRKYLIDIDGFIVYDHIGEGGYEETERKIQEALEERMRLVGEEDTIATTVSRPSGTEISSARSPEVYFGAARNELLENGKPFTVGVQQLAALGTIQKNKLYLQSVWDIESEYAKNTEEGAKIIFRYDASRVFMVARADSPVKIRVFLDGEPVGMLAGADVKDGVLTIEEDRLYELVTDESGAGVHTLELRVEGHGLEVFTFTFG